ncbi:MAG: DUF5329 domain-containing protein [Pseudomonadota bacterium]
MKTSRYLKMTLILIAFVLSAHPLPAIGSGPGEEIAHLLAYLKDSGCSFYRNGSWHSAGEAVAHLNTKYGYLEKRGLADTAEKFIDRAATKSSISGDPYMVKCANAAPVPSAAWFDAELKRYRESR